MAYTIKLKYSALSLLVFAWLYAIDGHAQVIKGTVVDVGSRYPLKGVEVMVVGFEHAITITDEKGRFQLDSVPTGRHTLVASALGYEGWYARDVLVTSGKEVITNIAMTEAFHRLEEVVITDQANRTTGSGIYAVSRIGFRPEDTRKFAGTFGDPARMLANFAGMASAADTRNDIIVRGNSPNGLLWRMEGLDILNPNHYGELTHTGGPVSLINSNNLGHSAFYSGAFPAQFGNALSGVFDLRLRDGNMDKMEYVAEIGFSGLEAGLEGPLSSKGSSSFLVNYRYSTLGIMKKLGLEFGTGSAIPYYQDLTFKIVLPLSPAVRLAVWGLGGPSRIDFLAADVDVADPNVFFFDNLQSRYATGMGGISIEAHVSKKTYGRLHLGVGYGMERSVVDSVSLETGCAFRTMETARNTARWSGAFDLSHKFNARHLLVAGINGFVSQHRFFDKQTLAAGEEEVLHYNQRNGLLLLKGYTQWKHQLSENLSSSIGVHFQTLPLNQSTALEPRVGLRYRVGRKKTFSFGYGMHAQMQNPLVYFYPTNTATGDTFYTNKNLGFTHSHHIVASGQYWISDQLTLKTEWYYQAIRNVPVEQDPSAFSALNIGGIYPLPLKSHLVNKGTGVNYGVEVTLQRYFGQRYYFLANGSLFRSRYKGSDGIDRNTPFNSKYSLKTLGGKDISAFGGTLSINMTVTALGGRYMSPIDLAQSRSKGHAVYNEANAPFSIRQSPYFRGDVKIGFRTDLEKSSVEYGVDMKNVTNRKNIFLERYNRSTDQVVNEYQLGFLAVPYFRWNF